MNENEHGTGGIISCSREQIDFLFKYLPDAGFMVDENGRYVDVNDRTCELSGVDKDTFLSASLVELGLLTHGQRKRGMAHIRRCMNGQSAGPDQIRMKRADGSPLTVEIRSHPVRVEGRFFVMCTARDVTGESNAEDALVNSMRLLNSTFNAIPDLVMVMDADRGVLLSNWMGVEDKKKTHSAANCHEIIYDRSRPCDGCPLGRVLETGLKAEIDATQAADGVIRRENIYPIKEEDGLVNTVVLHVRDVTDQLLAREEREKNARLESVGLLAGGVAHDFNNFLTAIMANISFAKQSVVDKSVYDVLEEAEKASTRAKNLTQQLLTFAEGGEPVKRSIRLGTLIEETGNFALRGSKCKAVFMCSDNLHPVEVDEGQIGQVISNIVINASQAMPDGGNVLLSAVNVEVDGTLGLPLKPGDYVLVRIEDEGIGIPGKILEKIFDPYFTTKQKGSGLGLSTSFSIIQKHGGHIAVDSRIGEGTCFSIYLPVTDKTPETRDEDEEDISFGTGRVLLMDDEEVIRKVVRDLLSSVGYDVDTAEDGEKAIEMYRSAMDQGDPYEAVILDLTVPGGMGGVETVKRLREMDQGVRAIVSSGYSTDAAMSDPERYGFAATVAKPYSFQTLTNTLGSIIKSRRNEK